ncbi:MAG: DHH family phosphoesterase [Candidatus Woesearchaeota archaeon]
MTSQIQHIQHLLQNSHNPLFFYDDDVDGLCAFLQLYKTYRKGIGIPCKSAPKIPASYVKKIEEHSPDLIVILDKPEVAEEILSYSVPIIWIDHHEYQENRVQYLHSSTKSTSELVYQITQNYPLEAICGSIADWRVPEHFHTFQKTHSKLCPKPYTTAPDILYKTQIGKICEILAYNLKSASKKLKKSLQILQRREILSDILTVADDDCEYIRKQYDNIKTVFDEEFQNFTEQCDTKQKICVFTHSIPQTSLTRELSNKLHYTFPDTLIIVRRFSQNSFKCSIRSPINHNVAAKLAEIFTKIPGHGGGHSNACGACVFEDDWDFFYTELSEEFT